VRVWVRCIALQTKQAVIINIMCNRINLFKHGEIIYFIITAW